MEPARTQFHGSTTFHARLAVFNPGASEYEPHVYGGRALRISGAVRSEAAALRASDGSVADVVLVLPEVRFCEEWVELLRQRVMPWKLIQRQVKETFEGGGSAADAQRILAALHEDVDRDAGEARDKGGGEQCDVFAASTAVNRAQRKLKRLTRGARYASVANTVAAAAAATVHGSDVANSVARVLGGVAFVGPIILTAALGVRCAELAAQSRDDRVALVSLQSQVPAVCRRMSLCLYRIL
jgi:hypothetical protein